MTKIACFTLTLALVCASSFTSATRAQAPAATASNIDAAMRSTRTLASLFELGEQPRRCISDFDEMVFNVLLGKEVGRLSLGCS